MCLSYKGEKTNVPSVFLCEVCESLFHQQSSHSLFITWTGKAGSKTYKNAGKTFQNATFMSVMWRNLKSSVALMHTEHKAEHGLNIDSFNMHLFRLLQVALQPTSASFPPPKLNHSHWFLLYSASGFSSLLPIDINCTWKRSAVLKNDCVDCSAMSLSLSCVENGLQSVPTNENWWNKTFLRLW